ncbi:MAG: hypothetical protein KatS3mg102_1414 [Planctomycetota bacterium]|nr:MAG: hypothetical protein KatS3mg102_1414 [Planctomycetota bacterium]
MRWWELLLLLFGATPPSDEHEQVERGAAPARREGSGPARREPTATAGGGAPAAPGNAGPAPPVRGEGPPEDSRP